MIPHSKWYSAMHAGLCDGAWGPGQDVREGAPQFESESAPNRLIIKRLGRLSRARRGARSLKSVPFCESREKGTNRDSTVNRTLAILGQNRASHNQHYAKELRGLLKVITYVYLRECKSCFLPGEVSDLTPCSFVFSE